MRSRTRYAFSRDFRKHGAPAMSTYLKSYKVGDIVDIKVNGAIHDGMPFKFYHGKTGVVYNVTKSAVGIIVNKVVGHRYLEKRLNIKIEHVRHSKCRAEFLQRVKDNQAKKQAAKVAGEKVNLKRQPVGPRPSKVVSGVPTTLAPVAYEIFI